MKALILVGGIGTRLRPLTEKVPKPMVEINGKPFLEFNIENLKKQGITDIVLCVAYLGHIVEEYFGNGERFGVNITYSYENPPLGTAGAIKNAEHLIDDDFIAMNGDTFMDVDISKLLDFHKNHDSPFTMVICDANHARTQEIIELDEKKSVKIYKRGTIEHENRLISNPKVLANGGLYVMSKEILEKIPALKKTSLEIDIFPQIVENMRAFIHEGYMLDVADEGDLKEFKKDVRNGLIMPSITGYQKIIRSRAPVRITFGGGGTDISPYDKSHGGICVNATINRYVYSSLKLREDKRIHIKSDIINIHGGFETHESSFENIGEVEMLDGDKLNIIRAVILEMNPTHGFDLYVRSEVPPHSGLGASASLCVSIIGVLNHLRKKNKLTKHEIAETAFEIEKERLKNKGGKQDQYAAAFGGINLYEFKNEEVRVNPVNMAKDDLLEFEKNILVVSFARKVKSSGQIHKYEFENKFFEDDQKVKRLHEIKNIARDIEFNLRRGNFKKFGELIDIGWDKKKKFNPLVTNTYVDALIEEALLNGAIGARLMGAGGGGHLLLYCNPDQEHRVREILAERGAKSIDFSFDFEGLKIWEIEG